MAIDPKESPFDFSSAGETTPERVWIESVLWTGTTTAADTVELRRVDGSVLWRGQASGTDTYLGKQFHSPLYCPDGATVAQISSGRLLVYTQPRT